MPGEQAKGKDEEAAVDRLSSGASASVGDGKHHSSAPSITPV